MVMFLLSIIFCWILVGVFTPDDTYSVKEFLECNENKSNA